MISAKNTIFETNTIGITEEAVNVDDVVETVNHFRCIDYVIDHAEEKLTEDFIKNLHRLLKTGTSDSLKDWFVVGDYHIFMNFFLPLVRHFRRFSGI